MRPKDAHDSPPDDRSQHRWSHPMMAPGSLTSSRKRRNRIHHPRFVVGEQVSFAEGTLTGTGVVDAATADFSIIWVWTDDGGGRKMFLQGHGAIVKSAKDSSTRC
ncbi:hypothetical protein [Pseudarthrobacter sp. NBSH8]|uniref:hypothetical protein n=1 Tax=Pseudarthrobacter sp. NBSH8 TaxID=2596911 RepID=UPI002104F71D|nr:hypothetical protein [Pseudarthrobacter sp. NBSH8]